MKFNRICFLALLCSVSLCAKLWALEPVTQTSLIKVQSPAFYKVGEDLQISAKIDISDIDVASSRSMIIYPVVENDNNRKDLPHIIVNGKRKHILYKRKGDDTAAYTEVVKKNNTQQVVEYNVTTEYKEWMNNAGMKLYVDLCGCGGKPEENSEFLVDNLDNTLNVWKPVVAYLAPEAETMKQRVESGKAFLDFPVNKTDIYSDYRNNPRELSAIKATIDKVKNDENLKITHISIHGYASPEGSYENNKRLAQGRAEALRAYVMKQYNFDKNIYSVSSTPEDMNGLKEYIINSDRPEKEAALDMLSKGNDPDQQEMGLRKIGDGTLYLSLIENCYPSLRRSEYEVVYSVPSFTIEKTKQIMKTKPQQLSLDELYSVAQTYAPGSDDYVEAFELAVRLFPNDKVANLNAAAVALSKKDLKQAEKYLDKCDASLPQTRNNRAVLDYLNGNHEAALNTFKAIAGESAEANENFKQLK